jgi:hypothetical protein
MGRPHLSDFESEKLFERLSLILNYKKICKSVDIYRWTLLIRCISVEYIPAFAGSSECDFVIATDDGAP